MHVLPMVRNERMAIIVVGNLCPGNVRAFNRFQVHWGHRPFAQALSSKMDQKQTSTFPIQLRASEYFGKREKLYYKADLKTLL